MPIYEYKCESCGAEFEKIIKSSTQKVVCDKCGSQKTERKLSVFSAGASSTDSCPMEGTCPSAGAMGSACSREGGCGCPSMTGR